MEGLIRAVTDMRRAVDRAGGTSGACLKRVALALAVLLLSGLLSGCSLPVETEEAAYELVDPGVVLAEPIIITSIGQSVDVHMVKELCERMGLKYQLEPLLAPADLTASTGTLVLVLGANSRCIANARTTLANEIARAKGLLTNARDMEIATVAMHIGGKVRRDASSDQLIVAICPRVDYLIAVEEGNQDGLLTRISRQKQIPLQLVPDLASSVDPFVRAVR
jgi:hypothetical protein